MKLKSLLTTYSAHRIKKRPPLRPAIPSPYTGASSPKVIYVSSSTPFKSVVKRVHKLLRLVDQRATGKASLGDGKNGSQNVLSQLSRGEMNRNHQSASSMEEVLLKGTGKAVEKVLGLGLFFAEQDGVKIRVGTGTISVVDDIVEADRDGQDLGPEQEDENEIPETQIRRTSMIEVGISLK